MVSNTYPNQARDFALFFFFPFFRFRFRFRFRFFFCLYLCLCLFFSFLLAPLPYSVDVLKETPNTANAVVRLSFFVLDASMYSSILVGLSRLFGQASWRGPKRKTFLGGIDPSPNAGTGWLRLECIHLASCIH